MPYCRPIAIDSNHFLSLLSDWKREIAGAAVKFQHAIRSIELCRTEQRLQHLPVCCRIYLSENIGIDHKARVGAESDCNCRLAPGAPPVLAG